MVKNKEETIWDDSALINAFNDAVSMYKDGENVGSKEPDISANNDNVCDSGREAERSDVIVIASDVANGKGESPLGLETEISEMLEDSSKGQYIEEPYLQNLGDYDQLLKKYHEIEDQRQKVLEQLTQSGYWNNGYNGSVPVASYEHQAVVGGAYPPLACSSCPYGCQSWLAPCSSLHTCCLAGGSCGKPCKTNEEAACDKESNSRGDNDFVSAAMLAAERALSSLKEQTSVSNEAVTVEEKEKNPDRIVGHSNKSTSSQTDLTVVLNAWYSAGFYTGKYLSEQASAKDRHG